MLCYKYNCIYCFEGNCMANASDPINEVDECKNMNLQHQKRKQKKIILKG